ncbi:M23 family metallopeptidase [Paenibacillus hemerocallicola]|uniref:M23 family metallopeptidase n=2 Tax=Paenibacillus hemerocallicola TaxID=1172614 RepID=A0A5C4T2S4_9BACL|nr:M23 family metallopeptidase [Paenibacillus hemerocallicola]
MSSEHPEGQLPYLRDALGRDCVAMKFVDGWTRAYAGDGKRNEDWFGWNTDVLAPFEGKVEDVYINPKTNEPGMIDHSRSSSIVFSREDGVKVVYAHVREVGVYIGDAVKAGDVVCRVGNNGYSRHPHIHVGAWRGKEPLQIRFDLRAMGEQLKQLGDEEYLL